MFSDVSAFSLQYITYSLVSMVQGRTPALFFLVVVIIADAKNKALKVLCIGLHTGREEFLTKLLAFIISESWLVKSWSKDSSLLVKKGLAHVGIMGK